MSGPPAHLVAMTDEEIIALFLSAVAALKIDDQGVWSLPAEIEVTTRLARQVQERTEPGTPLGLLATTVRVLLWRTGIQSECLLQLDYPALARSFYQERAALSDLLPPTPVGVADITGTVEPSERAVLHNGKWVEPETVRPDARPRPCHTAHVRTLRNARAHTTPWL